MEFWQHLALFAAQAAIIVFALSSLIILIALVAAKSQDKPELEIELLHKKYKHFANILKSAILNKDEQKEEKKKQKKSDKEQKHQHQSNVFVIDFNGDIKASATDHLREEISAILNVATPQDEVVIRVESPGGVVHGYGLAASQLLRVREKNIPLTICVDKVAASGGYLMSCVGNKILSAPFAIIGSIGVIAQVPNFHQILKKHDVDYKEYTAGEYKRTISILGEITPKGEEKFKEQLEATHSLFKQWVGHYRPQLEMSKVATGEYWYGQQALELKLVDELSTSDDYLAKLSEHRHVIKVNYMKKQKLADKLSHLLGNLAESTLLKVYEKIEQKKFL
ncbi:MAG: protease SohB [Bdellovibrionaceae bacterium]|nr:protease SohB [Pseudobdellovibrionaceae bacterium]